MERKSDGAALIGRASGPPLPSSEGPSPADRSGSLSSPLAVPFAGRSNCMQIPVSSPSRNPYLHHPLKFMEGLKQQGLRMWILCLLLATGGAARSLAPEGEDRSSSSIAEEAVLRRLKVFVYELPSKYNEEFLSRDARCLRHMFAAEVHIHERLLSSSSRTFDPEEANWFYTPVYTACQLLPNGDVLPFDSPRVVRSAIRYVSSRWPYWNRTDGADHFFTVPHDFGACFHFKEVEAIKRGILPLLQRATLLQTFGARNHTCCKEGSITIPPFAPPDELLTHLVSARTPRSTFAYFRGQFYDTRNDPEGGYYSRGARASLWENLKANPLFDISTERSPTYYEDIQRSIFCLCPLGWAAWCGARLVEYVVFGCIPVIVSDGIVLPFEDTVPWDEVGVFVKEQDVPMLDSILSSIPVEVVLQKQRLLGESSTKRALLFRQDAAEPGDAFHQIMVRLARRLPHSSNVFLKPGQRVLNWSEGQVQDLRPW